MLPAVIRLIQNKGVQEAIKKYGKKAVDEAKKHINDMKTKPSPGQKKISPVTKSQRANRETMRRSGATGAAVGYAAGSANKEKPKAKDKAKAKTASKPKIKGTHISGDRSGVTVTKNGKVVSKRPAKKK
jgi:hypothetical protein